MNTRMKTLVVGAAAGAGLILSAGTACGSTIVYNQPVNPSLSGGTYFFSFERPNGSGIETADRFSLSTATTVEALGWAGAWAVYDAAQPVQNITGWKVRFYTASADGSNPAFLAAPLIELSISDVPSTALGTTHIFPDTLSEQHFGYSADLPDFTLPAGNYFLSVQAILRIDQQSAANTQLSSLFLWDHSTPNVDDLCAVRDIGAIPWSPAAGDRAFTIIGTQVPGPATAATVFVGTGLMLRRRRTVA
ncbi:MAG TPA: hypothetical protein VF777_09970 [Phycisphaerales bacterium]